MLNKRHILSNKGDDNMRDFEYLPYEKAVEAMAREYAKVKPIANPLDNNDKTKVYDNPPSNNFTNLENTYCYNLEFMMLLRQLEPRITRAELKDNLSLLINIKTDINRTMDKLYYSLSGKYPPSPVTSTRMITPVILRKLLHLQSLIVNNIKALSQSYPELHTHEGEELRASIMLDNIVLIITSL